MVQKTLKGAIEKLAKRVDTAYTEYRVEVGKTPDILPSKRTDFDVCSAKYVKKALKYMPLDKPNQDKYMADMLNVCSTCATQGEIRSTIKKLRKSPMSGWICYLKTCAIEEPNMRYNDCMLDEGRKEKLYINNKVEWKQEALKGCPRGTIKTEASE